MEMVPLAGEPLALDLINTRFGTPEGALDLLATAEGFGAWLAAEAGRLTPPGGGGVADAVDLGALRALRDQVAEAVAHASTGTPPPASTLLALTEAQRGAPGHRELAWVDGAVVARPRRGGDPTAVLLAELAEAAADLLTSPAVTSVRCCEGPDCTLLFLPAHPRRRWCSPALCGNRVRVARYYQRHKDQPR
ncbi:ABATE domain-containing protein [Streptacidiphilus sp. EB129]|uniref:CGNR zinc finger domain-containing protein n=1 Tax=Streptacidiphilus sp. EB129 TaxID=3156262 RepID=UPI003517165A